MKTEWDYTELAEAYLKRPGYAEEAIDKFLTAAGICAKMKACDIGAGTGNLTLLLLRRGLRVVAIEPNDTMRRLGIERTKSQPHISWCESCAEATRQPSNYFDLVTFGSSFNVVDRHQAFRETARILKPGGWFVCLWNHRNLDDPLQRAIERTIQRQLPHYSYGVRRQDQTEPIRESGLFDCIQCVEAGIIHRMAVPDFIEAWRSHASLRRQACNRFEAILGAIGGLLSNAAHVDVPYTTRVWMARKPA